MSEVRHTVNELMSALKQQRDELRLKVHLGSKEMKDEWDRLEERFVRMKDDYEPLQHAAEETTSDVWQSLKLVGEELRDGFNRIRKSL